MFARLIRDGSYPSSTVVAADPNAPVAPLPDLRRMARHLGPVAVFAASNFPLIRRRWRIHDRDTPPHVANWATSARRRAPKA